MRFVIVMLLLLSPILRAEVLTGTTREQVIAEHGQPTGFSRKLSETREILVYPTLQVLLEDGIVVQVTMKPVPGAKKGTVTAVEAPVLPPPPPPKPAEKPPETATAAVPPPPATVASAWITDYEAALIDAKAKNKMILALFTGTDWCPPCIEFEREVANSKAFLDAAIPNVVLLKLDFPQHTQQSPALKAQNELLKQRIGISGYPNFFLLTAEGQLHVKLRTTGPRDVKSQQEYFIQALQEGLDDDGGVDWKPLIKIFSVAFGLAVLYVLGRYWGKQAHKPRLLQQTGKS